MSKPIKTGKYYVSATEYEECYVKSHKDAVFLDDDETETLGDKLTNIDESLESFNAQLSDALNPLTVTLSLGILTAELGSTISSEVLTWSTSKDIVSQALNGISLDAALRTYTDTTSYTSAKTYSLICTTAGGSNITKTATLNFYNGIFYGVSSSTTYDSTLLSRLTKVLSGTKSRSITVTAGSGEYIYYALPTRLGTPSFSVGGFSGGFTKVATITFTNSSGYAESYDIWRSDIANLGATTVAIS